MWSVYLCLASAGTGTGSSLTTARDNLNYPEVLAIARTVLCLLVIITYKITYAEL